jgi:transketolase
VSAPCIEWFNEQSRTYRDEVLPRSITNRVSVEAGIAQGWRELIGDKGTAISLEHYGASASASVLFKEFGFTPQAIVEAVIAGTK